MNRLWSALPTALSAWGVLLAEIAALASAFGQEQPPGKRPNIVLILADDLGFETIGANGGQSYRTPRLDQLAATGMRFEHCYALPLCTPTRIQLMTGQSNARNYIRFGQIDPRVTTFAHLFEKAGYATAMVGKWQLGREVDLPRRMGFQEYYLWQHTRRPPRYANPGLEIMGKEVDYVDGQYGPDLLHQFACDFISRHKDKPFLLYYSLTLTHAPYQPTPDSPDWDPRAFGEEVNRHPRHFGEMVQYMDKLIGKLVDHLDALGLREQTMLLFTADNGTGRGIRSQWRGIEVAGGKGLTTRAGMRVPLIVNWPGTVVAGKVCTDLVDSTDILPTICEAAGVPIPPELTLDGRSFWPQLRGKPGQPRQWIYCWYSPRQSADLSVSEFVFNQRWKLYKDGRFYDLESDPEETRALRVDQLEGDAAAAYRTLSAVFKKYEGVRPAELDQMLADGMTAAAADPRRPANRPRRRAQAQAAP
ncbi:MAG: sulfatase-like hydrolase/transferase [Thermoguttaceae bacterium]|nr:sulfatase-like hydrolase/transferase [Thermoguttaceae bacterium]MDW8079249.1 sulfatase-like hydrolase/transferase [Thermoguttaceae bacterium]